MYKHPCNKRCPLYRLPEHADIKLQRNRGIVAAVNIETTLVVGEGVHIYSNYHSVAAVLSANAVAEARANMIKQIGGEWMELVKHNRCNPLKLG